MCEVVSTLKWGFNKLCVSLLCAAFFICHSFLRCSHDIEKSLPSDCRAQFMNVRDCELLKCFSKVVKINCVLPCSVDWLGVCSVSREWNVAACGCVRSALEGILGRNSAISWHVATCDSVIGLSFSTEKYRKTLRRLRRQIRSKFKERLWHSLWKCECLRMLHHSVRYQLSVYVSLIIPL
jgi:hypothetical protein